MNPIRSLRLAFGNLARSVQLQAEIREGLANLTDVVDRRMAELIDAERRTAQLLEERGRTPGITGGQGER